MHIRPATHTWLCRATLGLGLLLAPLTTSTAVVADPAAPAPSATQKPAKIDFTPIIRDCGFELKQVDKTIWTTEIKAIEGTSVRIALATADSVSVVFSIPFKKEQLASIPDVEKRLSEFNRNYDLVKVFIDDDGDLAVRIDCNSRILDARELHDEITQVANVSEIVLKKLKP